MRHTIFAGPALLAVGALSVSLAASSGGPKASTLTLQVTGTGDISAQSPVSGPGTAREFSLMRERSFREALAGAPGLSSLTTADKPRVDGENGPASERGFFGFPGLTHYDQRFANNGNQFSLEPPDQGLAVGGGFVLEAVNSALAVYTVSGKRLAGPTAINAFLGLPPAIVRSTPLVFGPFVTDPRCYFDSDTKRWFVTASVIDSDPATGASLPHSSVYIAVSATPNPLKGWNVYALDTTNATGTPEHAGCPCFGDQPLIGADKNAFFVSTNEFPIFVNGFNGAQVYAVDKRALASGSPANVVAFSNLLVGPYPAYSIQPATVPPGGDFAENLEYLVSSAEYTGTSTTLAVWAAVNTSAIGKHPDALALDLTLVSSELYGMPPAATQKAGPTPLGTALGEPLEMLETNDDRMQQVVYAQGRLWGGLNTVVTSNGADRAGIAWFVIQPQFTGDHGLSAEVSRQGYIALKGQSVLFPSIGVNKDGKGVMTFTLSGPDYYPSVAYARISEDEGAGHVMVGAPGAFPEDGFTGYVAFGGDGVARWGDYSAAVADEDGSIWIAAEYIPNSPRTLLANWGTFIGRVKP